MDKSTTYYYSGVFYGIVYQFLGYSQGVTFLVVGDLLGLNRG